MKNDETRGNKATVNATETKASSGDEPGLTIIEVDNVPSKGVNCRLKKPRVKESGGSEDRSKAEEGDDKSKAKAGKDVVDATEPEAD